MTELAHLYVAARDQLKRQIDSVLCTTHLIPVGRRLSKCLKGEKWTGTEKSGAASTRLAESEPHLAWLLLVSSLEIAASVQISLGRRGFAICNQTRRSAWKRDRSGYEGTLPYSALA